MKTGTVVITGIALIVGLSAVSESFARPKPVNKAARFKHADRNKDGKISPRELAKEKQWEHKQKSKVNTPWEAKADKNNDGVVQPREAKRAVTSEYLKKHSDVNRPWEAKADTNGDGKVSAAEMRKHHFGVMDVNKNGKIEKMERKLFWVHRRAKVDTALERKYDANGNGLLEGDEAQALLKDRLIIINTHGKAKVDSVVEHEYDANLDGVIDREEALTMKDALGI